MKKVLYYLSNIILGIYLVLYIPIYRLLQADNRNRTTSAFDVMQVISFSILLIGFGLRLIFSSKKIKVTELDRKINIILFAIELVLFGVLYLITGLL